MAVTVIENKGPGILGNIGSLATLGGMATGQPWLTMLGTGLSAADSMINPQSSSKTKKDALNDFKDAISAWKNPASGNIAKGASSGGTDMDSAVYDSWRRNDPYANQPWF